MFKTVVFIGLLSATLVMVLTTTGVAEPSYIYAIHDPGGEGNMSSHKGWIVFTEAIGHNPGDSYGGNYSSWSSQGYGVIVRLNNGYGSDGTIPYQIYYQEFADRCARFVQNSSGGVDYWIIGNEMNGLREWPGNNDGDPSVGEAITVTRYADCYNRCWTAIKAAAPSAKVVPGAIGTWGPPWPAQGIEGFMDYWTNMLNAIGASKIDGLAIHTYTHGCDPALVTDLTKMGAPYQNIYYNFQVYRQYMAAIPTSMNTKPVLITECDQNIECADGASPKHAWSNTNNGWVRAVYAEINNWNLANAQKIRCLALFRWMMATEGAYTFEFQDRDQIVADFQQAVAFGYQWSTSTPAAPTGLTATAGDTQISLTWNASAAATSYKVKRSTTAGGPYTTVATPTTTNFTNTGLTNGTRYYYVVSAVNASGESANSSEVNAVPAGSGFPITIQRGNGLANVFAKLNSGQSAKIAYIGGSVTQNPGWRDNVTAWFNSKYPGKITEVNAGWSGTGSLIGAMRLARDVLAYNPDLIFIEFAINDETSDSLTFVRENSEGMVRQIWQQNPSIDICFIETISYYIEAPYLSGYYPTTVQAHYDVCDLYGIPSVNVGWALYLQVLGGTSWESLTYNGDRVHPNTAGSLIYSNAVNSYLESERTRGGSSISHSVVPPLTTYPVTSGVITDMVTVSPLPSGWSAHYNEFGLPSFVQSSTVNSTISIGFSGRSAAVKIQVAADSGNIQYSIDGGGYATAYIALNGSQYVWAFPVAKDLASTGAHTLTLRVVSGTARIVNVEAARTETVPDNMNGNTPTGTNSALTAAQVTTDSYYGAGWEGTKATDGSLSTKWCSNGNAPPHWIAIDLGSDKTVNGFIVRLAGAGGEYTSMNFESFIFQSGTSMSGPWTNEATIDNTAQASVVARSYNTPKTQRYLRLYITDAGVDNYARLFEFEVYTSAPTPPATPTGLVATAGDTQVSLTWTASSGATSYNVKRSTTSGGPYTTIASPTTNSYTNTGLTNGTPYHYVVSAVNGAGESANSSQASATPTSVLSGDFESMPTWASTFDAGWGNAADWAIVSGGQSGNCLQASRTGNGSSARTLVYGLSANTSYTLSIYMRCPSGTAQYWAETAYKFGSFTAQDFDANSGTWTMIQKFADNGTNGNGDVWTQYSVTFNSGSNTQVSVGFKLGSSGTNGPVVKWDTLRIQADATSPTILLSPTSLSPSTSVGASPASQSFTVQNTGGGTLNYSVGVDQTWLSVSPTSGTSTTGVNTHTVSYSTASLSAGTYAAAITVTDPSATNSPRTVNVNLTVTSTNTAKADFNHDGYVDSTDFNHFMECLTGAESGPPTTGCEDARLDNDDDIDQADFGLFQRCLSGSTTFADPDCAD